MLEKTHKTRFPHLNATSTLAAWREAKAILDATVEDDYAEHLGCVGKPLAALLDDVFEALEDHLGPFELNQLRRDANEAAFEARTNLAGYISGAIDNYADMYAQDAYTDYTVSDVVGDLGSTTLDEAFDHGFSHGVSWLKGCLTNVEIDEEGL